MTKNIIIFALILIVAALAYLYYTFRQSHNTSIVESKFKIDSIERINSDLNDRVVAYKDSVEQLELSQQWHEDRADSLATQLKRSKLKCPEKVFLLKKETTHLRTALKKCKLAKAIQVKTIQKLDTIIINNEVVCLEKIKVIKVKDKSGNLKAGLIGGGSVLAIVLAILIAL